MLKFVSISLFTVISAHAATLDIIGPCSKRPILSLETSDQFETVGDLTMHYLRKNRVQFQGNERGINSMFNTPIGLDAMEVLSDTQMRSYGWCFRVNGRVPESYADQVNLNKGDHVEWYFGYAWYDKGWISICNPSYEVRSPFLCK